MTAPLLAAALVLDALLGEPPALWSRLPHPAVLMGRLIDAADLRLNHGPRRKARGIALMTGLGLGALALGALIQSLPMGWLLEILIAAILLAQRSLVDHVAAVAAGLRRSLPDFKAEGRIAMVVEVHRRLRIERLSPRISEADRARRCDPPWSWLQSGRE